MASEEDGRCGRPAVSGGERRPFKSSSRCSDERWRRKTFPRVDHVRHRVRSEGFGSHLHCRTEWRASNGGLFDILEAVSRGESVDLPAVRAHQRAAVVTVFAVVGHVLRRYGDASLAEEWDRQIGRGALRITAPHDEPAFLQLPTGTPTKRQSIESLDCLLPRVQHEVKETFSSSSEK